MIVNQTKLPWIRKGPATQNPNFPSQWTCTITTRTGIYISIVYGNSRENCEANTQAILEGVDPTPFFRSFWGTPKVRMVIAESTIMVADLVAQAAPEKNPYFNTNQYSSPLFLVNDSTSLVPFSIVKNGIVQSTLALHKEFQKGIPWKPEFTPALGQDMHAIVRNIDSGKEWELLQPKFVNDRWQCDWGGVIWNVAVSDGVMPIINNEKWGARATSLPMEAGLITLKDLAKGSIDHMVSFAIQNPKWAYIYPALRTDGFSNQTGTIPAGQIFQLPQNFIADPSWCPLIQMLCKAVTKYGMILSDRSANFCFFGEDPTQYNAQTNLYAPYLNGIPVYQAMRQFPFTKLQAVSF